MAVAAQFFLWVTILSFFFTIYFIFFIILGYYRKKRLDLNEQRLAIPKLKISEKKLAGLYDKCKALWDQRYNDDPHPENNHVFTGYFIDEKQQHVSIKETIADSITVIENSAVKASDKYRRKKAQTVKEYLYSLREVFGNRGLTKQLVDRYLIFYHKAKYGNPSIIFENNDDKLPRNVFSHDDYERFVVLRDQILDILQT